MRSRRPPRAAGRAGTTLIELIVVLAVVGVLLGVSVVAIGSSLDPVPDPRASTAEAVTDARRAAAQRGERVRLYLLRDGRYQVVSPYTDSVLQSGSLPLEDVQPAPFSTTVFPEGTTSGGEFRVRWQGDWHHLRVDRVTGRVESLTPAP